MRDRYEMSGPEEGDSDHTVVVCDTEGPTYELIEIRAGTLSERKTRGTMIAHLLNVSDAVFLT